MFYCVYNQINPVAYAVIKMLVCFCVVKKDTVAKECKDNEEYGEDHSFVHPSLSLNAVIHHYIPILSG